MRAEVEQLLDWLAPAFAWAAADWPADQPWAQARPVFLATVDLDAASLNEPGHGLVRRFVEYVDSQLSEGERRVFLNDPSARADVIDMFVLDHPTAAAAPDVAVP
ncbi:MAG TPA: hypothetical protein VFU35_15545 [Jatrophihabitans sp.]|nr:hypothetical protein [Jatrophihabitans sp.]